MMLIIINLTKVFTRGETVKVAYFLRLWSASMDSTLKKVPGGVILGTVTSILLTLVISSTK